MNKKFFKVIFIFEVVIIVEVIFIFEVVLILRFSLCHNNSSWRSELSNYKLGRYYTKRRRHKIESRDGPTD